MKTPFRKILLVAAAFVAATLGAAAQGFTVTGKVVDAENGEGEIGAIIQFFNDAISAEKPVAFTSAGADGSFSQNLSAKGDYHILVSNMGRKDAEKSFTLEAGKAKIDLGTIRMETDAKALDAATVTTQKVLVKMDVDRMTYNVSEDVDSKSATVLDMLRKVPMVTVDGQDNITVNGSSSFLVTVDGKPNQMLSQNASVAFKMMPASAVERIEVITNPGVKYDAEGVGGVLNLTTARASGDGSGSGNIADGQYGSIRLEAGNRAQGAGGMLTMQRGRFSFSVNANAGYFRQGGQEMENVMTTASDHSTRTLASTQVKSPMFMGDLSMSYELDSLNLFSATAGGMFFQMKNTGDGSVFARRPGMSDYALMYSAVNGQKSPFNNYHVDADWQHNFGGHPGRMLTLSYRLNDSPAKVSSYDYYEPEEVMASREMEGRTGSSDHTFQGDFTAPLGDKAGTLSTGVKFIFRQNLSEQDEYLREYPSEEFVLNEDLSTDYHYYNRIGAAYAEYSGNFGKWGVKAGGRYEYTWQNAKWKQGDGEDFSKRYGSFVPTASLQYNISMTQNIGLSYNMRISRPGISYLNPYVDKYDPTHWTFGNTDLEVEKSHNAALVYNTFSQKFMMNASLRYSRSGNGISEYTFTEDGILKTTYGNILERQSLGASSFVNVNLGKKARVYANLSLDYTDYRNEEMGYARNGWNWNIFAGGQQTLPWDLQLSEGLFVKSKDYSLQGWNSGFAGCFGSLTKTFLNDRLSVSLQGFTHINSLDRKVKFEMYSEGKDYTSRTTVTVPVRQISLSLSWTFGQAGVSVKKADRGIENDSVLDKAGGMDSVPGGNVSGGI